MLPQQVTEALHMVHSYEKDPEYQVAIGLLQDSLLSPKLPKDATPEQKGAFAEQDARNNKQQVLTLQRWQKMVEQQPNADKLKLMKDALQPAVQQQITDQVNQIFGSPARAPAQPWWKQSPLGYIMSRFTEKPPVSAPKEVPAEKTDYDREGYEKEFGQGSYDRDLAKGHLTDKYKLPNHITFSTDSKYSKSGQEGGDWKQTSGKWYFTPSDFNLSQHSIQEYTHYFDTVEKSSVLRVRKDGKLYDYLGNGQWKPVQR